MVFITSLIFQYAQMRVTCIMQVIKGLGFHQIDVISIELTSNLAAAENQPGYVISEH
jgi:hypothetical protein